MTHSTLWVVLNWVWIASEIVVAIAFRTRQTRGAIRDRGSLAALWVTIVASMTATSWVTQTQPPTMLGAAHWLVTAAFVSMLAGLIIRWTAIVSLGKSFSANVAIRESQQLKTNGIYRAVRHPSYLGLLLIFIAAGIYSRNWVGFAVALLPTTAALLYRIHVEEHALIAAFGAEYRAYCQHTKRLLPWLF